MAGVSFDQDRADHLVEAIRYRFRYVPAARLWLEYRDGLYRAQKARENLRDAYLLSLEELPAGEPERKLTREEYNARHNARTASAQSWMYWLLERDARLTASPPEFSFPGPYRVRPEARPFDPETSEAFSNLLDALSTVRREPLLQFLHPADSRPRTGASRDPHVMLRLSRHVPDLTTLVRCLEDLLGREAIVRLAPHEWTSFPNRFTPELAMGLIGAHVCLLEGPEKSKRPPQTALLRWACYGAVEFTGHDGGQYRVPLPPCFIVGGPAWAFASLDEGLRPFIFPVEG